MPPLPLVFVLALCGQPTIYYSYEPPRGFKCSVGNRELYEKTISQPNAQGFIQIQHRCVKEGVLEGAFATVIINMDNPHVYLVRERGNYVRGERHGLWDVNDRGDDRARSVGYRNGQLVRDGRITRADGSLEFDARVRPDGVLDGPYKAYHENGKLREDGTYFDGQVHGTINFFDASGTHTHMLTYTNNERHGPFKSFHWNGAPAGEGRLVWGETKDLICFDSSGARTEPATSGRQPYCRIENGPRTATDGGTQNSAGSAPQPSVVPVSDSANTVLWALSGGAVVMFGVLVALWRRMQ